VAKLEVVEESSGAKKQSWRRPYENPDYTPNCSIRQYWEVWEPGPDRIWMQNSLPFLGVYAPWRSREARGALMKVCTVSDLCKTVLLAAGCEILWMVSSSPHLWHDAMPRDATRSQPSWGALMPSVAQCRGLLRADRADFQRSPLLPTESIGVDRLQDYATDAA
jgi:hypothetical protein